MEHATLGFGRDELALLGLRNLFEQRGFCRIKTGKFEEYSLYVANKNFLDTEQMITFMDPEGKLLALKPDATLSIVKNIPKNPVEPAKKLYYIDEVYRLSPENREYKVHSQIGVELIGPEDPCANLEIVDLALESLGVIGEQFALDISHLGFVSGLLAELGLSPRVENRALQLIHAKNSGDLAMLLHQEEVPEQNLNRALTLAGIHGGFSQALCKAKELICNAQMETAYQELAQVAELLHTRGGGEQVNLDFSVVNDLDYYNGLILRGYIEGIPSLVLTGGRYDNLLRRMKKQSCAIGFAISLDDLSLYLKSKKNKEADMLITYSKACDFPALLALAKQLNREGKTVRLELEGGATAPLRHKKQFRYHAGQLEEVAEC